ncbi:MAG: hypothetical protein ACYTJ0_00130 [Planctomycetota bacterium]|jgi:hypothetical protein
MLYSEIQRLWSNRLAVLLVLVGGSVLNLAILHLIFEKPVWSWRSSDLLVIGMTGASLAVLAVVLHVVRLTVTVSAALTEVALSFHRVRRFETADIVAAEPVRYRPWRDYGGWGVREPGTPGQPIAVTISGRSGVVITFRDGERLLIGTRRPERLAAAIRAAVGTGEDGPT